MRVVTRNKQCTNDGLIRILNAKQKQPGFKKVRGQSEATMVISDQKL